MKNTFRFVIVIIILSSCGKTVEIQDFESDLWKKDTNGCNGDRISIVETLLDQKDKLKGLNQTEIVEVIGKPDRNELYKRSQKFFEYQITPDKSCDVTNDLKENSYLSIRFNATGLAKEILLYTSTVD